MATTDTSRRTAPAWAELRLLLGLAWPVIVAELGWVTMWIVDTMMVGRLGAAELGAAGFAGHVFFAAAIVGIGMLLALDFPIAHAFGAGDLPRAHRTLVHGLYLAATLSGVLTLGVLVLTSRLDVLGLAPAIHAPMEAYLWATAWSMPPLLLFTALRRYLQAIGAVLPVMVVLLTANVVNALADWALIFGRLGAPALGVSGAGWATVLARTYMLLAVVAYVAWREYRAPTGLVRVPRTLDLALLRVLVRLGVPASLQLMLEMGSITVVTALAARLTAVALAAHQVALSVASVTFMVPLGLSSAAAVVVGRALGRGHPAAARRSGWLAIASGAGFMSAAAVVLLAAAPVIVRLFTPDAGVIATGATLLWIAALFQLSDGVQVVTTGVLRGTGDTRTPMLANLVGHWLVSLPLGVALCFALDLGVVGLWLGLAAGLSSVAVALLLVWGRRGLRGAVPVGAPPRGRAASGAERSTALSEPV